MSFQIAIIEDEMDLLSSLKEILEKKHQNCYILRSYSEALESVLCDVIKIRLLSISF